jgi:hypothetical protein
MFELITLGNVGSGLNGEKPNAPNSESVLGDAARANHRTPQFHVGQSFIII